MADRAGPKRRVERKVFWSGRVISFPRGRAVHPVGVKSLGPKSRLQAGSLMEHQQAPLTPFERGLDGIAQPNADLVIDHQPVHDHFNRVLLFRVQLHAHIGGQFDRLTVHPRADEPFTGEAFDHVAEFSLFVSHNRRQQHDSALR